MHWLTQWFAKVIEGVVDPIFINLEPDLAFHYIATSEARHRFAVRLSYGLGFKAAAREDTISTNPIDLENDETQHTIAFFQQEDNTSIVIISLSSDEIQQTITFFEQAEMRYPVRGFQGILMLRDLRESELP